MWLHTSSHLKQIQIWEAEEFHRTKVRQPLALCHINVGFRDVISNRLRVLDHMLLSLDLLWKNKVGLACG